MADLHLYNQKLGEKLRKEGNTVGRVLILFTKPKMK